MKNVNTWLYSAEKRGAHFYAKISLRQKFFDGINHIYQTFHRQLLQQLRLYLPCGNIPFRIIAKTQKDLVNDNTAPEIVVYIG